MKYLALDIGNVCISIDPIAAFAKMGFKGADPALLAVEVKFETGYITEEEFCRAVLSTDAAKDKTKEQLCEIFDSILISPVPGMTELIASLPARGIQPVFFSDISTRHLAKTREMFPAAKFVPYGIYSFATGAMKPHTLMYRAFEARFGKPFLYTDDRADLISAAQKRGWKTHRFTDASTLEKVLFS